MFKFCVITDEISQDFNHALDVVEEIGLEYIELRTMWGKNVVDLTDYELRQIKKVINSKGLKVSCIASPFLKCPLQKEEGDAKEKKTYFIQKEEDYNGHLKILERSIELAHFFDTNFVRSFSFWKKEKPFWQREDVNRVWKFVISKFQAPVKIAEREGITLMLENEHDCNIATSEEIKKFFEEVNSKFLGLIWDPGNAYFAGEKEPYPLGYQKIKNYIGHIHIKDAKWNKEKKDYEWVLIGDGEIDYRGIFETLARDRYEKIISFEPHITINNSVEEGFRESVVRVKEILKHISK